MHNKNSVRLLAILGAVAVASGTTAVASSQITAFVHLLGFATWLGATIWTTFIAGVIMFKNLPRQTFGKIQSKLFPGEELG